MQDFKMGPELERGIGYEPPVSPICSLRVAALLQEAEPPTQQPLALVLYLL